jgi:hypothetical protein
VRPTPSEVVQGVRRILRDVIEPDLASEHARKQLRQIRAVLAQVDWNDAGFALAERNGRLADALMDLRRWIEQAPQRISDFAVAAPALQDIAAPEVDTFDSQAEWERRLSAAAVAIVDPLADWFARFPDDRDLDALRRRVLDTVG